MSEAEKVVVHAGLPAAGKSTAARAVVDILVDGHGQEM